MENLYRDLIEFDMSYIEFKNICQKSMETHH